MPRGLRSSSYHYFTRPSSSQIVRSDSQSRANTSCKSSREPSRWVICVPNPQMSLTTSLGRGGPSGHPHRIRHLRRLCRRRSLHPPREDRSEGEMVLRVQTMRGALLPKLLRCVVISSIRVSERQEGPGESRNHGSNDQSFSPFHAGAAFINLVISASSFFFQHQSSSTMSFQQRQVFHD